MVCAAVANMVGKYFLKNVQQVFCTYKNILKQREGCMPSTVANLNVTPDF